MKPKRFDSYQYRPRQINLIKKIISCIRKRFPITAAFLCDIPIQDMPASTKIGHPFGIVISPSTTFGENCTIYQNVTIGNGEVIAGNNVLIGAGVIILGNIKIGNDVKIGAGAIILKDIPDNTTVVGVWK